MQKLCSIQLFLCFIGEPTKHFQPFGFLGVVHSNGLLHVAHPDFAYGLKFFNIVNSNCIMNFTNYLCITLTSYQLASFILYFLRCSTTKEANSARSAASLFERLTKSDILLRKRPPCFWNRSLLGILLGSTFSAPLKKLRASGA